MLELLLFQTICYISSKNMLFLFNSISFDLPSAISDMHVVFAKLKIKKFILRVQFDVEQREKQFFVFFFKHKSYESTTYIYIKEPNRKNAILLIFIALFLHKQFYSLHFHLNIFACIFTFTFSQFQTMYLLLFIYSICVFSLLLSTNCLFTRKISNRSNDIKKN